MKNTKLILTLLFTIVLMENTIAQDWANLKQFQKANEALKHQSEKGRIVFMGNSITQGWIENCPDYFEKNPYVNRGINGQTTPQMLLRFRQDVIDLNPEIVVILAGLNDIAGNTGFSSIEMITNNIESMVQLAKSNNIKVLLCSVLPAIDFYWRPGQEPAERILELNRRIKSYAEKNNIVYIDYYPAMVDENKALKKEYGEDGVHPNAKGYAVMKPIFESALAKITH